MSEMKTTVDRINIRLGIVQTLLKNDLDYVIAITYF